MEETILIVDDDQNLRRTLEDILRTKGYRPISVSCGTSALVSLESDVPAVALIDLKMEDMSGLDLMAKIRKQFPTTECIMITGHTSSETAIEAINLGAFSYLEKPYDIEQLLLTLRRAVEKRKAEVELRQLKEFHETIVQRLMEGIVVDDENERITFVNPAMEKLVGYAKEEMLGKHWSEFLPVDQQYVVDEANERRRQGVDSDRYEVELLRKDGTRVPVLVSGSVLYDGKRHIGSMAVMTDITSRKKTEERLRYISMHDALTGLYNRGCFEEELARLEREQHFPISVVMVDIDDLKLINDTRGHEAGDEVVRRSAAVLKKIFRADDIVARIGGDEFAVLLTNADENVVNLALDRLRAEVDLHNSENQDNPLSLSFGSATIMPGGSLTGALKAADQQMYQEKFGKGGRSSWNTNPLSPNKSD